MQNYAMHSATDNALFQLHYLFHFTFSVFSHQQDSFLNGMMHHKRHWDIKASWCHRLTNQLSLRTVPSCIRTKRFLELLEALLYPAVLQIFVHDRCET